MFHNFTIMSIKAVMILLALTSQAFAASISLQSSNPSYTGTIPLTWSGGGTMSAYFIFENGSLLTTVGGHVKSYTITGKAQGTHSYRVEGCISQGCQSPYSGNQSVSPTINILVGDQIELTVRRHTSAPATSNATVDSILRDATEVAWENNSVFHVVLYVVQLITLIICTT